MDLAPTPAGWSPAKIIMEDVGQLDLAPTPAEWSPAKYCKGRAMLNIDWKMMDCWTEFA